MVASSSAEIGTSMRYYPQTAAGVPKRRRIGGIPDILNQPLLGYRA
jgi:hypothetical protein